MLKLIFRRFGDISSDQSLAYRKRNRYPCTYKYHRSCSIRNTKYLADTCYKRLPGFRHSPILGAHSLLVYCCYYRFKFKVISSLSAIYDSFLWELEILLSKSTRISHSCCTYCPSPPKQCGVSRHIVAVGELAVILK